MFGYSLFVKEDVEVKYTVKSSVLLLFGTKYPEGEKDRPSGMASSSLYWLGSHQKPFHGQPELVQVQAVQNLPRIKRIVESKQQQEALLERQKLGQLRPLVVVVVVVVVVLLI